MTKKLSAWSQPGEKPPCVGVWETDYATDDGPTYQYWDGLAFRCAGFSPEDALWGKWRTSWCDQSMVRFRGLAEKPE